MRDFVIGILKRCVVFLLFLLAATACPACSSGDEDIVETDFEGNIITDRSPDDWQPRLDPTDIFKHTFSIRPAYPNPTDSVMYIEFATTKQGLMSIGVYEGNTLMRRLSDQQNGIGQYSITWDLKNEMGQQLESGAYEIKFAFTPNNGSSIESSGRVVIE